MPKNFPDKISRRDFLKTASLATMGVFVGGCDKTPGESESSFRQENQGAHSKTQEKDPRFEIIARSVEKLRYIFGLTQNEKAIIIDISDQKAFLISGDTILREYPISTARKGIGSLYNSGKTPLGTHRIQEKIGEGLPLGAVMRSKAYIGTVANNLSDNSHAFMTSRILSLDGQEEGINRGGRVDTYARRIYLHGTSQEQKLGTPVSGGCIRMKNTDILELFNVVPEDTLVEIQE